MLARVFRACGLVAIAVVGLVGITRAEQASPADDPKALFDAGVSYLKEKPEPKYEEALELFRACYAKSGSFRALLPMGVCELHLERDGDAIAHFRQYLAEGGSEVPPDLRAQAERDIAMLSASLVRVTLSIEPVGATIVDERTTAQGATIVNRYAATQPITTLGIHPGRHALTITSNGRVPKEWSFEAGPGATLSAEFRLEAKAPARPFRERAAPSRRIASRKRSDPTSDRVPVGEYVGLALTGVFLGGAIVTGLLGHGKKKGLRDANARGQVDEANQLHDDTVRLYVANGVLLAGAVVAGGTTAYFHLSRTSRAPDAAQAARVEHESLGLRVRPALGMQSGRVILSGRF